MRALKTLTIVMGIMIVVGTIVLGVLIARRVGPGSGPPFAVRLDQPEGARIAGVAATQDRLAVLLQGGGPDRVLLIETRSGALAGTVSLGSPLVPAPPSKHDAAP